MHKMIKIAALLLLVVSKAVFGASANLSTNEDNTLLIFPPNYGVTYSDTNTSVSAASNGTTSVDTNLNKVRYVPNSNYCGGDSFTITTANVGDPDRWGRPRVTIETLDVSVTVNCINDLPTISNISNVTISEDSGQKSASFTVSDLETASGSLSVSRTSSNTALIPTGNISFGGSGSNRIIYYTPAANQSGSTTITVTVSDGTASRSDSFVVTVTSINDAPSISNIANVTISEDAGLHSSNFTISDVDTWIGSLSLSATSSNSSLIPSGNISFGGSGSNRTVYYTPAANQSGSATITVTVSDGVATRSDSFVVTVNAVNDTPTISNIGNATINEDAGQQSASFTISDVETASSSLTLTKTSSNSSLIPSGNISFGGSGSNRTVYYTPAANQSGSATITVTVSDGAATRSDSFVVTVNAVNDVPTISNVGNATINEDAGQQSASFTISDVETASSSLTLTKTSSNSSLIPSGNISFGGSGSNRTVYYTPAANQSGSATITVTVSDGAATRSDSFVVTVNAVNDAPTISTISDKTINVGASSGAIAISISDIDSAENTLILSATSSNHAVIRPEDISFAGSEGNRTLSLESSSANAGISVIKVTVSDGSLTGSTNFNLTVDGTPDYAAKFDGEIPSQIPDNFFLPDNQSVGALEGSANVSGGAATYSIPIAIPPGRAGMQPNISLNYSSRSGKGITGVGWSLSAGSSIHRCGQIYAVDSGSLNVTYDSQTDRLCLDGQRLIPDVGEYGVAGTTYRTEIDSFVKVTQNYDINSSSSYFKVQSKDGRTSWYGNSADSKHRAHGRTEIISWAINRVEDASQNNAIKYAYESFGEGENLISQISYSELDDSQHSRRVEFKYLDSDRADKKESFLAGGKSVLTKLLDKIETYYGQASNTPIRQYQMNYGPVSQVTGRVLLRSVTECAYLNQIQSCLLATNFNWIESQRAFTKITSENHLLDGLNGRYGTDNSAGEFSFWSISQSADVDGDGGLDILRDGKVFLTGNQEWRSASTGIDPNSLATTAQFGRQYIDHDLDGKAEFIRADSEGKLVLWEWDATGTGQLVVAHQTNIDATCLNSRDAYGSYVFCQAHTGDFNGDGFVDLLVPTRHACNESDLPPNPDNSGTPIIDCTGGDTGLTLKLYLHNANTASPEFVEANSNIFQNTGYSSTSLTNLQVTDFDGDGRLDLVYLDSYAEEIIWFQQNADMSFTRRTVPIAIVNRNDRPGMQQWNDVNGDGLLDLLVLSYQSTSTNFTWKLFINQGDGSLATGVDTNISEPVYRKLSGVKANKEQSVAHRIKQLDFDGDGINDWLVPVNRRAWALCQPNPAPGVICPLDPNFNEGSGNDSDRIPHKYDTWKYEIHLTRYRNGVLTFDIADIGTEELVASLTHVEILDIDGDGVKEIVTGIGYEDDGTRTNDGTPHDLIVYKFAYQNNDALNSVKNGLGVTNKWTYSALNQKRAGIPDLYQLTENGGAHPPYFNFSNTMTVVSDFESSNGAGGFNKTSYRYKDARYHIQGRGYQGFKTIIVDTPAYTESGEVKYSRAVTDFYQEFPLAGKISEVRTCLQNDEDESCSELPLSKTLVQYHQKNTANEKTYWVFAKESLKQTFDLKNRSLLLSEEKNIVNPMDTDDYGNVRVSETELFNGYSRIKSKTIHTFDPADESNWWVNKLNNTVVSVETLSNTSGVYNSVLDSIKSTTTTIESYDSKGSRQPAKVTTSASDAKSVTVETVYNDYGLPTQVTTSSPNETSRIINTGYSADGYFSEWVDSGLGKSYSYVNPVHGQPDSSKDLNGLVTNFTYDSFGRVEKVTPPVGSGQPIETRFATCVQDCDNRGFLADVSLRIVYKQTSYQAGTPESTIYKDQFNRVVATATRAFDGANYVYTTAVYDALGRKVRETIPSHNAAFNKGTHFDAYDAIGRLTQKRVDQSMGQSMTVTYNYTGHQTSVTANNLSMSRTHTGSGQLLQTVDSNSGVTQYAYDAVGNPIVLQDANGNTITATYNSLGQKLWVNDPNMGNKTFTYTGFGEVASEADANGDTYAYQYDAQGRIYERLLNGTREAYFEFDTALQGSSSTCIGLPASEELNNSNSFKRSYAYDSLCRPLQITTTIDSEDFVLTTHYDANYGRVKGVTYPTGITLENWYNSDGYLTHQVNAASDYVYHEVTQVDAQGQVLNALKANGVLTETRNYDEVSGQMTLVHTHATNGGTQRHRIAYTDYDNFGNLKTQQVETTQQDGSVLTTTETYGYDDLHRLIWSNLDGTQIDYSYDKVGNLTKKDDYATSYIYGDIARSNGNAGPNAVRQITKASGGTIIYSYDNNGNLTSSDGPLSDDDKVVTYNAFNKPLSIARNGITNNFSYASDQMRYKQVKIGKADGTETTLYIGKDYEEIRYHGKIIKKSYLGDTIITETADSNSTQFKVGFVHRDRLNSVVTITDENGNVVDNKSYDPFGKPRKADMSTALPARLDHIAWIQNYLPQAESTELHTRRGFTDHEHLDDAELIHMNGRVYDYNLGRFLSVDPFIQEPGNSQSMNPYSYIMNNPLAGTDPSGYLAKKGNWETVCEGAGDCEKWLQQNGFEVSNGKINLNGKTSVSQKVEEIGSQESLDEFTAEFGYLCLDCRRYGLSGRSTGDTENEKGFGGGGASLTMTATAGAITFPRLYFDEPERQAAYESAGAALAATQDQRIADITFDISVFNEQDMLAKMWGHENAVEANKSLERVKKEAKKDSVKGLRTVGDVSNDLAFAAATRAVFGGPFAVPMAKVSAIATLIGGGADILADLLDDSKLNSKSTKGVEALVVAMGVEKIFTSKFVGVGHIAGKQIESGTKLIMKEALNKERKSTYTPGPAFTVQ